MNLPNKITLVRIILIPFFLFFYLAEFIPYGKLIATGILILACLTDAIDGYIARKYNLVTDLGKLLDPVADKAFYLPNLKNDNDKPLKDIDFCNFKERLQM